MFGIRVKTGHRQVRPAKETFSDGKPVPRNACKNSLLYYRLAEPFSDSCLYTYRGAGRVQSSGDYYASKCFSYT